MALVLIVNLYITRLLLRALGIDDFGIYNVVGGVVAFTAFLNHSIANGFQRFFNIALGRGDIKEFQKLFSVSISVQCITCMVFILLAETIGLWIVNYKLIIPADRLTATNIVYQASILVLLFTLLSSPCNAVIISHEKMGTFAVIGIIQVLLKLAITSALFLIMSDRLITFSILLISVEFIVLMLYVVCSKRISPTIRLSPATDRQNIKEILVFSGWNLFGSFAHTAKGQGLNIVLNMFFGPAVNAARGVAFQVSSGVNHVYSNFQIASRPQIIKSYATNRIDDMIVLINNVSRMSFFLLWIPTLPLLFKSDWVLRLWLGNDLPPLAPLFNNLVLLTSLVECLATPISNIAHATGRMKRFQVVISSLVLLVLPAAYIVLSLGYPPEAALICSLVMAPIIQFVRLLLARRLIAFSIRQYFKQVVAPCLLVLVISFAVPYVIIHLCSIDVSPILLIVLLAAWATACAYRLGMSAAERVRVKNIISRQLSNLLCKKR